MRDYLNRLRQQFQRFMIGRYGMDQFGRFLSGVLLALIIFNLLIPAALPSRILWALEWIVLIILYARMFSKNINKRYQENEAFLRRQFYVSEWWKKWKFRYQESRSIIFTVVRTANRKCVFQEEEDGSVSTARNAGLILSRKVKKDCMTRPAVWKLVFFCDFIAHFCTCNLTGLLKFYKTYTIPCFQLL